MLRLNKFNQLSQAHLFIHFNLFISIDETLKICKRFLDFIHLCRINGSLQLHLYFRFRQGHRIGWIVIVLDVNNRAGLFPFWLSTHLSSVFIIFLQQFTFWYILVSKGIGLITRALIIGNFFLIPTHFVIINLIEPNISGKEDQIIIDLFVQMSYSFIIITALLFYLMLDYYFCEECQTYHQPNRYINGEILSACECSISTQPSIDSSAHAQITPHKKHSSNLQHHQQQSYTIINPEQNKNIRYESPRVRVVGPQNSNLQAEGIKFQNMPFISIVDEENRNKMQKFPISPPKIQRFPTAFLSPRSIKQQVPIRKATSPIYPQRHIIVPQQKIIKQPIVAPQRIQKVQTAVPTSSPMPIRRQQIRPSTIKVMSPIDHLPIQTMPNPNMALVSIPFLKQPQISNPTINIKPPLNYQEPSIENLIDEQFLDKKVERRVELERASGNYRSEYDSANLIGNRQIVCLQRVTASNDIALEKQEKTNCCTGICYS